MDWSKLFKGKTKTRPDPRIRWFGKLPTYPDYYSSAADEEWAVEFNDWILKGVEVYQGRIRNAPQHGGRLPIAGCVIRLPRSGMTVFSSILDFGGDMRGRPFPMCFYAALPTALWPGPTSERLAGAASALREILALRRDVVRFINSPGRFESAFGERFIDLDGVCDGAADESWVAHGKAMTFADWFQDARAGLKTDDAAGWARSIQRWGAQLAAHEGKTFEPTFRFPLAMRRPLPVQVAGWIRWLESRMDVGRRKLSMIVSGELEHESGHLTVIARDIVKEDFLLLTPAARTLPYLDDLLALDPANGAESGAGGGSTPDGTGESLGSWVDFVQR